MIKKESLSKLLAGEVEYEEKGESFELVYLGHSEIDKHYTKPMLPWIISEIKKQNKFIKVKVVINDGRFEVTDLSNSKVIINHTVKQIHKCLMEQADHRCFLYTLRPTEKIEETIEDSCIPVPSNLYANQNYHCHLYQASKESEVRSFFNCLRQQPRETKLQDNDSLNSLADLSVHTESQFFEVLFVGRVKVSHSKVPGTFIDEALTAFKQKEKSRRRHCSGDENKVSSPNRTTSYQMEGSGHSVPTAISLKSTLNEEQKSPSSHNQGMDCTSKNLSDSESIITIEPLLQRMRQTSIGDCSQVPEILALYSETSSSGSRARANSMGTYMSRNKGIKAIDTDLRSLGYDFNRTMLFHIGHREIQLINPEIKSVQLNKPFKDIAGCSQGVKANDHFGFICRELAGESLVFVGYIFRCDKSSVADEIMLVLNRSFSAMHEAQQRDRKEHLMCDFCPLKWYSLLCAEVEGLPAPKAHSAILKRIMTLPEEEKASIIMKYEGAETSEVVQKNNVLMLLLRMHFEYKQSNHEHPNSENMNKSDFTLGTNIESSLKKARKSITTSFSSFLKRDQRDLDSAERDVKPAEEVLIQTGVTMKGSPSLIPAAAVNSSCVLEGISDSPLRSYRLRSSTVSGAGGESIRKELMQQKTNQKTTEEKENLPPPKSINDSDQQDSGTRINLMNKIDNITPAVKVHEPLRPTMSFRHAILQAVASPSKGMPEKLSRKGSSNFGQQYNLSKRSKEELMILWKKCIFQQILLLRIERENQRRRAIQKEVALLKVKLNYQDEKLPTSVLETWELLLSRPEARIDTNILSSGIKRGAHKMVRGEVWNLLTIQEKLYSATYKNNPHPEHYTTPYEDILKGLTSQHHAILIDLGRTFPSHPYFTQTLGPGQLSLFNILKAYSILDPEVGYCQGLSFVGGVLLMHVEEEVAYELLKHLMYDKGCRKQYRPDLDGLQIRMYQLSRLVHDKLFALHYHLEKHEVTTQLYAAPWFLTIFASQFPLPFVGRVFDLLFLNGMESVFCVSLVLLQRHEEQLISLDSFEQIMDYFKNFVSNIPTDQLSEIFAQVCECNVKKELSAYQVEYQVLQEELSLSPQQDANVQKLRDSSQNLKRQNLDLLEQLHNANNLQQKLESSNQCLKQSQHHLEVRVRWLEMERNNMKNLIERLCHKLDEGSFTNIPPNLQRYLPNRASSPMPEDCSRKRSKEEDKLSVSNPRQHSFSPIRVIEESSKEPEEPAPTGGRPRSTTLDSHSMQKYFKKIIN